MAVLIKIETVEEIVNPPEGFATLFYAMENGRVVKKIKFPDGTVQTIAEE